MEKITSEKPSSSCLSLMLLFLSLPLLKLPIPVHFPSIHSSPLFFSSLPHSLSWYCLLLSFALCVWYRSLKGYAHDDLLWVKRECVRSSLFSSHSLLRREVCPGLWWVFFSSKLLPFPSNPMSVIIFFIKSIVRLKKIWLMNVFVELLLQASINLS